MLLPGEVLTGVCFVRKSAEAIVPNSNELHELQRSHKLGKG